MKNVIHILVTLLMLAVKSLAISALFTGIMWLMSLMHICKPPTWVNFFWGAVALFIFFVLRGLWAVIKLWSNK